MHAANLGVRADLYDRSGGWSTHTVVGEDHALWRRLRTVGAAMIQPTDLAVTTSSRTRGRVLGGFAHVLARLDRTEITARTAS